MMIIPIDSGESGIALFHGSDITDKLQGHSLPLVRLTATMGRRNAIRTDKTLWKSAASDSLTGRIPA